MAGIDFESGLISTDRFFAITERNESRRPCVIVETHSLELEHECMELLRAAGYKPQIVDQRRRVRDYRPLDHNRWLVAD